MKDSLKYLNKIEPMKQRTVALLCLEGWKLYITSLLAIWDYLHGTCDYKFLLINRLSQDCAENLFSIIRGKGSHHDNPNP